MNSSFSRAIQARHVGAATFIKGKRTHGTPGESFTIYGTIQPANGKEVKTLEESIRSTVQYKLYSGSNLNTHETATPHQIRVGNEWYDITESQLWDNNILPHKKYFLFKIPKTQGVF